MSMYITVSVVRVCYVGSVFSLLSLLIYIHINTHMMLAHMHAHMHEFRHIPTPAHPADTYIIRWHWALILRNLILTHTSRIMKLNIRKEPQYFLQMISRLLRFWCPWQIAWLWSWSHTCSYYWWSTENGQLTDSRQLTIHPPVTLTD